MGKIYFEAMRFFDSIRRDPESKTIALRELESVLKLYEYSETVEYINPSGQKEKWTGVEYQFFKKVFDSLK